MPAEQREALPRCCAAPPVKPAVCVMFALAAMCGLASVGRGHVDPWPAAALRTLLMGSIELHPCASAPGLCGKLDRPLDPTGAIPGRISIYFEYYPHSAPGNSLGTLVATEGGPGYAATLSRDEYLALFKPLRQKRDVLIMDNRGTGQSAAIDCRELQTADKPTVDMIAACGRSLGDSAPLYSAAYAADDLAAILDALAIHRIDLYGDSYGTYFEQVFSVRHPNMLRSIVLDGAYAMNGEDYPWYPSYAPAMRDKFNIACRRFEPCARLPGSSIDHILPALQSLRSHAFTAHATDSDGKMRDFTADPSELAIVMFGAAPAFVTVRELDAAARAFSDGDRVPLLRLMAETIGGVSARVPDDDPAQFSAGLAAAATCQDPPQIFDMRLSPMLRTADRDRAVAERKRSLPDTYAPFTIDEYRGMPLDYSFIDQCVEWPVAPPTHPASHVVAADATYPDIPALIISGELDNITTPADGAAVAREFKRGTQIRIANSFHVNALPHARSNCAAQVVRRFIETLEPGDAACAQNVPPLRLVARFATHASQVEPAAAAAGNRANALQRSLASAALMTAGDVLARLDSNSTGKGVGLRGGSFLIVNHAAISRVTLHQVRWTEDLAVSGTIDKPSGRGGTVRASLHLDAPDGLRGDLIAEWPADAADSSAVISGTLGGAAVRARTAAP
jgi:pimeloyl-ACP methyl ester carboxylesterase